MKLFKSFFALSLAAILAFAIAGCSDTTTNPPQTFSTVTFDTVATRAYLQFKLDTANGHYGGNEMPIPTSADTLHARIVNSNGTYQGKNHVIVTINDHSANATHDTIYQYQDSGKLYRYNFGAETLNNNPSVSKFLGSSVQLGWIEQVELQGKAGDTWTTTSTIGPFPSLGLGPVEIDIVSQQMNDTTMAVLGVPTLVKHAAHHIYVGGTTAPLADGTADTYVDLKLGTVYTIIHTGYAHLGNTIQSPGQTTLLVK